MYKVKGCCSTSCLADRALFFPPLSYISAARTQACCGVKAEVCACPRALALQECRRKKEPRFIDRKWTRPFGRSRCAIRTSLPSALVHTDLCGKCFILLFAQGQKRRVSHSFLQAFACSCFAASLANLASGRRVQFFKHRWGVWECCFRNLVDYTFCIIADLVTNKKFAALHACMHAVITSYTACYVFDINLYKYPLPCLSLRSCDQLILLIWYYPRDSCDFCRASYLLFFTQDHLRF